MPRRSSKKAVQRNEVVEALLRKEATATEIAKRAGISRPTLYRWKDLYLAEQKSSKGSKATKAAKPAKSTKTAKAKSAGRRSKQVDAFKAGLKKTNKTEAEAKPAKRGRKPAKVTETAPKTRRTRTKSATTDLFLVSVDRNNKQKHQALQYLNQQLADDGARFIEGVSEQKLNEIIGRSTEAPVHEITLDRAVAAKVVAAARKAGGANAKANGVAKALNAALASNNVSITFGGGSAEVSNGNAEDIVPLEELRKQAISQAVQLTGGDLSEAAKRLGIGRTYIYKLLADYNIKYEKKRR